MPTAMKNRPINKPWKGRIDASSSWRKSESDNSTPATKAPSDIDRPPACSSRPRPSAVASAAAVNISRLLIRVT